jgi:hypothetical protein
LQLEEFMKAFEEPSTCFRHALACIIWRLQSPLEALQRTVTTRGVSQVTAAIAEVLW